MGAHHERLAELSETERTERQAHRSLERELADAKAAAAGLREQLVSALADQDQAAVKRLGASRTKQEQSIDTLALRVDAAEQRADRAASVRADYQRDHADDLIAELEPDAIAAGAELVECARALIDADQRWRAVAQQTDSHLVAHPRAQPATDGPPSTHGLEAAVRACRDGLSSPPVVPVPRWHGLRHYEQQEKLARLEQLRRVERPTEAQQRERDRLCRELGVTGAAVAVG